MSINTLPDGKQKQSYAVARADGKLLALNIGTRRPSSPTFGAQWMRSSAREE